MMSRWKRWSDCSLCEQQYHGVVLCALGWAAWKTYLGRPETDNLRLMSMENLGTGLTAAAHDDEALSVREVELSMLQRLGGSKEAILIAQSNIANAYHYLGRAEESLRMRREVYSRTLKLKGREHFDTLIEARNLATALKELKRFQEAKTLMRKTMPVARRVLGESNELALKMRWTYAETLCLGDVTLDDFRKGVTTLEETERTARRVLGGAHPVTEGLEIDLRSVREVLHRRENGEHVIYTTPYLQ